MKPGWEFLANEARKPVKALGLSLTALIEFLALFLLRLVLWIFFFLLPLVILFSLVFHVMSDQAKKFLPKSAGFPNPPPLNPLQAASASTHPLKAVTEDLRFWLRELERLRS